MEESWMLLHVGGIFLAFLKEYPVHFSLRRCLHFVLVLLSFVQSFDVWPFSFCVPHFIFLYLQRRVVFFKIKSWMELSKAKQPSEKNKSCTSLKTAVIDSLVLVKFKFFAQTSKNVFVTNQTKKPVTPCLAQPSQKLFAPSAHCFYWYSQYLVSVIES